MSGLLRVAGAAAGLRRAYGHWFNSWGGAVETAMVDLPVVSLVRAAAASAAAMGMVGTFASASGQTVPLRAELVATGVNAPVLVTAPPGDRRIFIVGQDGFVRIVRDGILLPTPFLSIPVRFSGEAGLLGMAFHPDYATNGMFFLYASQNAPISNNVLRGRVSADNPDLADPASISLVISTGSVSLHNGGWIGFSPIDRMLWIASGDRAASANAIDLGVLQGKMLRIDPMGDDYPLDAARNYAIPAGNPFAHHASNHPAIMDYGLRNPWRCSFDRATGDLWIGDVGGSSAGEVNFRAAGVPGPLNFGWPVCDSGSAAPACSADGRTPHVWTYPRSGGSCSTVGGYVYRGVGLPGWQGTYFVGDYCSGKVWTLRFDPASGQVLSATERTQWLAPGGNLSSFGEDAFGELYICRLLGDAVYRIVPAVSVGPDCNGNGVPDALEIARGDVPDEDGDGVPDGCPACRADFNASGSVTTSDLFEFLAAWESGIAASDFNGLGGVTTQDVYDYFESWLKACQW